jgi:hypothetical protein
MHFLFWILNFIFEFSGINNTRGFHCHNCIQSTWNKFTPSRIQFQAGPWWLILIIPAPREAGIRGSRLALAKSEGRTVGGPSVGGPRWRLAREKHPLSFPRGTCSQAKSLHQSILLPVTINKPKKPAIQPNSGDPWLPGPAACPSACLPTCLSFLFSANKTSLILCLSSCLWF